MQGVFRDIEQVVADGRQYSALWPAMVGVWKRKPIQYIASSRQPDQISIRLNRERCGVALHLSPKRRGEAKRHPLNVIANCDYHWGSCANLEIRSRASGEPRSLALSYQVRASARSGMIPSRSRNPPSTRGS